MLPVKPPIPTQSANLIFTELVIKNKFSAPIIHINYTESSGYTKSARDSKCSPRIECRLRIYFRSSHVTRYRNFSYRCTRYRMPRHTTVYLSRYFRQRTIEKRGISPSCFSQRTPYRSRTFIRRHHQSKPSYSSPRYASDKHRRANDLLCRQILLQIKPFKRKKYRTNTKKHE